jgi:hypothetical protein
MRFEIPNEIRNLCEIPQQVQPLYFTTAYNRQLNINYQFVSKFNALEGFEPAALYGDWKLFKESTNQGEVWWLRSPFSFSNPYFTTANDFQFTNHQFDIKFISQLTEPQLDIFLSPDTPASKEVAKGTLNHLFTRVNFRAGPEEDVRVKSIQVTALKNSPGFGPVAAVGDIANFRLYDENGSPIGGVVLRPWYGRAQFTNLNWIIPKATTKSLAIVADIPLTSTADSLHIDLPGTWADISWYLESEGVDSGKDVTETGGAIGKLMTIK